MYVSSKLEADTPFLCPFHINCIEQQHNMDNQDHALQVWEWTYGKTPKFELTAERQSSSGQNVRNTFLYIVPVERFHDIFTVTVLSMTTLYTQYSKSIFMQLCDVSVIFGDANICEK